MSLQDVANAASEKLAREFRAILNQPPTEWFAEGVCARTGARFEVGPFANKDDCLSETRAYAATLAMRSYTYILVERPITESIASVLVKENARLRDRIANLEILVQSILKAKT